MVWPFSLLERSLISLREIVNVHSIKQVVFEKLLQIPCIKVRGSGVNAFVKLAA